MSQQRVYPNFSYPTSHYIQNDPPQEHQEPQPSQAEVSTAYATEDQPTRLPLIYGWGGAVLSVVFFGVALANLAVECVSEKQIKKEQQIPSGAATYFKAITIASAVLAILAGLHIVYTCIMYYVSALSPL